MPITHYREFLALRAVLCTCGGATQNSLVGEMGNAPSNPQFIDAARARNRELFDEITPAHPAIQSRPDHKL